MKKLIIVISLCIVPFILAVIFLDRTTQESEIIPSPTLIETPAVTPTPTSTPMSTPGPVSTEKERQMKVAYYENVNDIVESYVNSLRDLEEKIRTSRETLSEKIIIYSEEERVFTIKYKKDLESLSPPKDWNDVHQDLLNALKAREELCGVMIEIAKTGGSDQEIAQKIFDKSSVYPLKVMELSSRATGKMAKELEEMGYKFLPFSF